MLPGIAPGAQATRNQTLITALRNAKLQAMPKLCIDAADIKSYPGSGQVLTDVSASGLTFNFGATTGISTDDPAFNGTAGKLDANEFFSFDGGDYFKLGSANPSWVDNLHKDNALSSGVFWINPAVNNVSQALFGTNDFTNAQVGFAFALAAAGTMALYICRANGSVGLNATAQAYAASAWQMVSYSHNEGGGAGASWFGVNSAYTNFNGAVTSPSAAAATYPLDIGSPGNGGVSFGGKLSNGSRIGCGAIWEGVALTQAEITAIFNATRRRFGV